jgi:hypothetical protein
MSQLEASFASQAGFEGVDGTAGSAPPPPGHSRWESPSYCPSLSLREPRSGLADALRASSDPQLAAGALLAELLPLYTSTGDSQAASQLFEELASAAASVQQLRQVPELRAVVEQTLRAAFPESRWRPQQAAKPAASAAQLLLRHREHSRSPYGTGWDARASFMEWWLSDSDEQTVLERAQVTVQ